MTVTVNHAKTNAISDWTQAQLDEQIALGNFAPGTTLANIVLPSDWNNDHTLTGIGTMAEQDANNVAITGGTINGTTIGATTPSTGKFSSVTTPSVTATTNNLTLSAISTGKINLNTATANQVQITDATAANGQYTLLSRDNTGNEQRISANSSSGGVNFGISSAVAGAVKFYTNGFSELQAQVSRTASAVNYVQVTGATTLNTPIISAQGSDSNVSLGLTSKGGNGINFYTNGTAARQAVILHTTGTIANYVTLTGSVAGSAPIFSVAGSDTNIDLALTPKGTGVVRFGTLTATADTAISGYITIKDSGGTTRKLAVIT